MGTLNADLPGFVALSPRDPPRGKAANWGNAFLPGSYAGCYVETGKMHPDRILANLKSRYLPRNAQRKQADLLAQLNQLHLEPLQHDTDLETSIQAMELAFRMQFAVPEVFDVNRETKATLNLYGDGEYGKACLLARRLVQRGVRTVQVSTSDIDHAEGIGWDSGHNDITKHAGLAKACDQAIAALLIDLKQRGMLDETLVVWGGEFGRAPTSEKKKGRDHNHYGFTTWMAGGGVKGGVSYGATDRFGCTAVENPVHVHDLHATILHLMGLDHGAADLPLQRPRLPPDRRTRQGDKRDPRVSGYATQRFGMITGPFRLLRRWISLRRARRIARRMLCSPDGDD